MKRINEYYKKFNFKNYCILMRMNKKNSNEKQK